MSLESQILISVLSHEISTSGLSESLRVTPVSYSLSLADGTGANKAQVTWSGSRTLSGSSESLDTDALPDDRGTVTLTAVKAMYFSNTSTAALTAAAFGGTYPVQPSGVAVALAPESAGMTASGLTVTGSAGQTYDVILIGEGSVT